LGAGVGHGTNYQQQQPIDGDETGETTSIRDAFTVPHISHHILHLHCIQWFLQAGGFDGLLLDSLYEDASRRQQQQATYSTDPHVDPFAASTSVAPPTEVQMSMMAHQQQEMFGMPYQQPQSYAAAASQSQANPFGDAYSAMLPLPQGNPFHGHGSSLI
jgi:hypothetical protein